MFFKKKCLTLGFVLGVFCITNAHAYLLEEQTLKTPKNKCQIIYLTEKDTRGWHIKTEREECGKDKFLTGYHHITVYNAFKNPVEDLYGYFSNGYWTGNDYIRNVEFKRFSDELGIQKATFSFYVDNKNEIEYIGQMSTQKTNAGTYPAFQVCEPFRVLGVVKDLQILDNPHILQTIFKTVEKETRRFCPTEKRVMLFLSDTENPQQTDIRLFVKMNLATHRHQIIRPKEEEIPTPQLIKTETGETVTRIAGSSKGKRKELRKSVIHKKTQKQMQKQDAFLEEEFIEVMPEAETNETEVFDVEVMETEEIENVVESRSDKKEEHFVENEPKTPLKSKKTIKEETPISDLTTNTTLSTAEKAALYFNSANHQAIAPKQGYTEEEVHIPQKKSLLQPLAPAVIETVDVSVQEAGLIDLADKKQPLSHIALIAKVLEAPVLVQTAIHTGTMRIDGMGETTEPIRVETQGAYMPTDWYLVKGYFLPYTQTKKEKYTGIIQVLDSQKCATSFCQDKK